MQKENSGSLIPKTINERMLRWKLNTHRGRGKECLMRKAVKCELDNCTNWDMAPADIRERDEVILHKKGGA